MGWCGPKIKIQLDKKAEDWLINEGFSSAYGARPLKRLIQTNIINKVAHMILSNEIDEIAQSSRRQPFAGVR